MNLNVFKKFKPAAVLLIICIAAALSLSVTHLLTKEKISEAEKTKEMNALSAIFSNSRIYKQDGYYEAREGGILAGYASIVEGSGYGGTIKIAVGIYPNGTVKGVRVISHSETPGIGSKATEKDFLKQFKGVGEEELKLKENNGEIDAVTGATISSTAVVDTAREGAKNLIERVNI
jgi:electron transport complex protein RnfG